MMWVQVHLYPPVFVQSCIFGTKNWLKYDNKFEFPVSWTSRYISVWHYGDELKFYFILFYYHLFPYTLVSAWHLYIPKKKKKRKLFLLFMSTVGVYIFCRIWIRQLPLLTIFVQQLVYAVLICSVKVTLIDQLYLFLYILYFSLECGNSWFHTCNDSVKLMPIRGELIRQRESKTVIV